MTIYEAVKKLLIDRVFFYYNDAWLGIVIRISALRKLFLHPSTIQEREIPRNIDEYNYMKIAMQKAREFERVTGNKDKDLIMCYYWLNCAISVIDNSVPQDNVTHDIFLSMNEFLNKNAPSFIKESSIWSDIHVDEKALEMGKVLWYYLKTIAVLDYELVNYKQKQEAFGYLYNVTDQSEQLEFQKDEIFTTQDASKEFAFYESYKYHQQSKKMARIVTNIYLSANSIPVLSLLLPPSLIERVPLVLIGLATSYIFSLINQSNPGIYEQIFASDEYNLMPNSIYTFEGKRQESYANIFLRSDPEDNTHELVNSDIKLLRDFIIGSDSKSKIPDISKLSKKELSLVRVYVRKSCEAAYQMACYNGQKRKAGLMKINEDRAEKNSRKIFYEIYKSSPFGGSKSMMNAKIYNKIKEGRLNEEELIKEANRNPEFRKILLLYCRSPRIDKLDEVYINAAHSDKIKFERPVLEVQETDLNNNNNNRLLPALPNMATDPAVMKGMQAVQSSPDFQAAVDNIHDILTQEEKGEQATTSSSSFTAKEKERRKRQEEGKNTDVSLAD